MFDRSDLFEVLMEAEAAGALVGLSFLLLIFALGVVFSLIPWFVALARGCRNTIPIFVICLFFGWTVVGWVAAFIWACVDETSSRVPRRSRRRRTRTRRRKSSPALRSAR